MKNQTKTLYTCATNWVHEVGETSVMLFESLEEVKKYRKCWKSCGIVEIKLTVKDYISPIESYTGEPLE